jgi:hypothetical protein
MIMLKTIFTWVLVIFMSLVYISIIPLIDLLFMLVITIIHAYHFHFTPHFQPFTSTTNGILSFERIFSNQNE